MASLGYSQLSVHIAFAVWAGLWATSAVPFLCLLNLHILPKYYASFLPWRMFWDAMNINVPFFYWLTLHLYLNLTNPFWLNIWANNCIFWHLLKSFDRSTLLVRLKMCKMNFLQGHVAHVLINYICDSNFKDSLAVTRGWLMWVGGFLCSVEWFLMFLLYTTLHFFMLLYGHSYQFSSICLSYPPLSPIFSPVVFFARVAVMPRLV